MDNHPFIPVVLGSDINTYNTARIFYEAYGIKTHVFGKSQSSPSYLSKITEFHLEPEIDDEERLFKVISRFAMKNHDKKILCLGAGDHYCLYLAKLSDSFPENVIVPMISAEQMIFVQNKANFYKLCEEVGIGYPKTIIHEPGQSLDFPVPFDYPLILKPAVSTSAYEYDFEGSKKVYIIESREELRETMEKIYAAGYPDELIIQDKIPGRDDTMYVLTAYVDQQGSIKMFSLGHVLLQEHTPGAMGNYAVIMTAEKPILLDMARKFIDKIGYKGICHFDIMYDERDHSYNFFEINTRQGRNHYYVQGSGVNMAELLVRDYVLGETLEYQEATEPSVLLTVPRKVAKDYIKGPNGEAMIRLMKAGKAYNPLFLKGDNHPIRLARIAKSLLSHFGKFKTYYEKE